jgi:PAS domain S-box-containing protein
MPDGTIRWQRWSDRAIFDIIGNVVEYQSVGRDITEQKRSEEALLQSEGNYRYLIENANEAIIVAQDGMLKFVNPMMATLTGYSVEELTTLPYIEIIHPDDRVIVRDRHQQRISGEKISSRYMFRINSKDNSTRWVESSAVNIDWKGRPATLNFLIDITTRRQAEEALRETEERYRNIVEDQTEFICRFLPDGTHVFVNDAYCRYFSVAREVILGHKFSPVLYPDDKKAVAAFFATLTDKKPVGTIDHRIIMPDGTERWQRWSDRAIFNDTGNLVEYQSVGRDITEYKEVEARLQTTSKEYQNLLKNITDVYYRSDEKGRLILASQSWATLLNYPDLSECVGKNIAGEFYANPGDRSPFLRAVYQNGYVTDYEITLKKKDGTPVTVATSSYLYFDAAGHVLGVEGTFRDITERKRMTEVLKETERRLTDIISFLPDATFVVDREGKVIAWNRAIEEMTGVPAGDMIGKGNYEYALPFYGVRRPILINLIETSDTELEKSYSSVRRNGKILTAETGMAHVGGKNRILWGKASPLYNSRNEVTGAIESIRDFTEQRLLEDSLKQVNNKLNLMSSITRHDVSNNITVCLGYLELSKHKSLNPEMQKLIDILEQNIGAIQSQIDFTRVYQDLGVAAPVWQDLGGLLLEYSAHGKIPVLSEISNLQVYADPLIGKVFYNLHDNAVRHGEHVTEIHVRAQERNKDMIIIWEDDGVGVLQNEKEKIFNRGFGKNTGLGLFLVREILSITGISILENGETGKGARFEMTVPKGMWRIMEDKK